MSIQIPVVLNIVNLPVVPCAGYYNKAKDILALLQTTWALISRATSAYFWFLFKRRM